MYHHIILKSLCPKKYTLKSLDASIVMCDKCEGELPINIILT